MPSPKQYIAPYDLANRILGTQPEKTEASKKEKTGEAQIGVPGLRTRYESKTGRTLDKPLSMFSFTTFGAKDTVTRGLQVKLLEAFAKMRVDDKDPEKAIGLNQRKYKLMVAMAYLIRKDIRATYTTSLHGYGVLHKLLDDVLDVEHGKLDDVTKIECLSTLMNANTQEINFYLGTDKLSETQWTAIKASALTRRDGLTAKLTQDGVMARALGKTGYYIGRPLGYGTGFVFGRIIGESTLVYPLVKVLDFLFRGLFSVTNRRQGGDHGRMASMFLAGKYANESAEYACGVAGAMVLGDLLASGVFKIGHTVGTGLDLLGEHAVNGVTHLYRLLSEPDNKPVRMGIHVMTGEPVFYNAKGALIDIHALSSQLEQLSPSDKVEDFSSDEEAQIRQFVTYMQQNPSSLVELQDSVTRTEDLDEALHDEDWVATATP